jgi:hypothetical protein
MAAPPCRLLATDLTFADHSVQVCHDLWILKNTASLRLCAADINRKWFTANIRCSLGAAGSGDPGRLSLHLEVQRVLTWSGW